MNNYINIISNICEELNIKLTLLSSNWVLLLEKENKINYICGYKFPLNNHAIGNILDDKDLFYQIMINKNINIIEHHVIFKNYDKEEVINYFNKNNKTIVVKANTGSCGVDVYKINNQEKLFNTIDSLLLKEYSISLCPFYKIENEYRVVILNNKIRLIYGKILPHIIGNNKNTIYELVEKLNNKEIEIDKDINLNYIPKLNERINLNFKFNLSRGSTIFTNIDNELKNKLIEMAKQVIKITNINFASIDIIKTENELLIMEANSGIMLTHFMSTNKENYNIGKNIYKDAIKLMME